MRVDITIIDNEGRTVRQYFDTEYWSDAVDNFVGQLKCMGWIIPKDWVRVHDFGHELPLMNIQAGFQDAD